MIMKKYILSCISAMKAKLLLMLESRQHFVEKSDIYSMQVIWYLNSCTHTWVSLSHLAMKLSISLLNF